MAIKPAELVEALAQMDEDQRERFVSTLVFKWPELADSLMAQIGYELMEHEARQDFALHA
jgi:hypothetical protein